MPKVDQREGTTLEQEFDQLARAVASRIHETRLKISYAAQEHLVILFQTIGEELLEKGMESVEREGFLSKLSHRLQKGFPSLSQSLTLENLKRMQLLAETVDNIDQPLLASLSFDGVIDDKVAESSLTSSLQ